MKALALLGVGYILMAPKELPKLARLAGYSVGRSVTVLSQLRSWASALASQGEQADGDVAKLKESLSGLSSIRSGIRSGTVVQPEAKKKKESTEPPVAAAAGGARIPRSRGGNELVDVMRMTRKSTKKD